MDRNLVVWAVVRVCEVALRKESVDRNRNTTNKLTNAHNVALRKESVDRNSVTRRRVIDRPRSLSARRAWIEILVRLTLKSMTGSLSARRAWIEMSNPCEICQGLSVALRKESVDRNTGPLIFSVQPRVALRKESVDRNID